MKTTMNPFITAGAGLGAGILIVMLALSHYDHGQKH